MTQPVAMLIDMDDTILDDSGTREAAVLSSCSLATRLVPALDSAELRSAYLSIADEYWSDPDRHRTGRLDLPAARRHIFTDALLLLGHDRPDLALMLAAEFQRHRDASCAPFPGALDALDQLRAIGIRLALITNGAGKAQRAKIERFDLARHFDCILIEGEQEWGKPDTRVYQHALQQMGTTPAQTWMVGDNLEWEIAVPRGLGLTTVWVDCAGAGLPPNPPAVPDYTVRSIAELPALVSDLPLPA